ncbi:MAG: cation:proton antiporter, partial [Chloroflexi bacterium]|nr:cation:proton antiporter [Chloroflexota bacterium]
GVSGDARRLTCVELPVYRLVVPFFFVITGLRVDLEILYQPAVTVLAAVVTLVAIVTKLLGGVLGSAGLGARSAFIVGVGMVPRGEIGFVVVAMGRTLGVLPDQVVSVVVVMSVVTTLIAPPVLAALYRGTAIPHRVRRAGRPGHPLLPLPRGATAGDFSAAGRLPDLGSGPTRPRGQA